MHDPLKDLAQLTDALYQAELSKMHDINSREASLRQQLADLEDLRHSNAAIPPNDMHKVRQIGADVLWEGWVSRARADLNTQLAQVLAQKAHMTVALRHAFGKQNAAREMLETMTATKNQQIEKRQLLAQDELRLIMSPKS